MKCNYENNIGTHEILLINLNNIEVQSIIIQITPPSLFKKKYIKTKIYKNKHGEVYFVRITYKMVNLTEV